MKRALNYALASLLCLATFAVTMVAVEAVCQLIFGGRE